MPDEECSKLQNVTKSRLKKVHQYYLKLGLSVEDLEGSLLINNNVPYKAKRKRIVLLISLFILLSSILYKFDVFKYIFGIRCVIPNNYFVWEATRPISDCNFCSNVTEPIILYNVTREQFQPYAYSSKPIVVRNAFLHWPAKEKFSWQFFKDLYDNTDYAYESVDKECQFLHFKSDFISLRDVFAMSEKRVKNLPGTNSWYVGWGNCDPKVLKEMRKYYPKPHFLPEDAEIPYKEYVFMGYDDGATMHLDFINRLMWQAQLKGSKIWKLLPPPECHWKCQPLSFHVGPGDGVLVDTRVWYHATQIPNGEFSLSVQSEYG